LEAVAAGLRPRGEGWAYAARLVTLDDGVLVDGAVTGLTPAEAEHLLAAVPEGVGAEGGFRLVPSGGGRAVLWSSSQTEVVVETPPRLAAGKRFEDMVGSTGGGAALASFAERAAACLRDHPVNEVRVDLGENPANGIWPWSGGAFPTAWASPGPGRTRAAMLTDRPFARGVARLCGMETLQLGDPWTAEAGACSVPLRGLVATLRRCDELVVYVGAPGECGWFGGVSDKVRALGRLDQNVLAPLKLVLDAYRPYRLCLVALRPAASAAGRPAEGALPWVAAGEGIEADTVEHWDEAACAEGALGRVDVGGLMGWLRASA
jgi:2,3-bisphosphoglycerate-independent phosphoglycerate mutase